MSEHTYVLTDVQEQQWQETLHLSSADLGLEEASVEVRKRTLRGGLADGVDAIEIDNGALSFTVLPTRGMSVWKGSYRGLELGWNSPVRGPVHPKFVHLSDMAGLGWVQGFDEWIVRCGLGSNGAPGVDTVPDNNGNPCQVSLNLHGRIANQPANRVEVRVQKEPPHAITIFGCVDESMLFTPRLQLQTAITTWPGSNRLRIEDRVHNLGAGRAEMELLYHCNFGPPFLEAGSKIDAPFRLVGPRDARAAQGLADFETYRQPEAGFVEQVYWQQLHSREDGETMAVLSNRSRAIGAALRFNTRELPWLTQWKNTGAPQDGFVTGIEPGTDLPNCRTFEREKGRLVVLEPGQIYPSRIEIEVVDNASDLSRLQQEVASIQSGREEARILPAPDPDLSP